MRVAAAQIKINNNINDNTDRVIRFMKKSHADIVCFPETCINPDEKRVVGITKQLDKIKSACLKYGIAAIVGSYVRDRGIRNRSFFIGSRGSVLKTYDKTHMWGNERNIVKPGRRPVLFNYKGIRIGMITCFDFAFPAFVAKLSKAHVIFCPSFMVDSKGAEDVIRSFPVMRAYENKAYFVQCDAVNSRTAAMSMICSPFRIEKSLRKKEGVIHCDIYREYIDRLKKKWGVE